jgi:OOP family OmpA-OmpF porin
MTKRLQFVAAAAAACAALMAVPAHAQSTWTDNGLYIGGSIGRSDYKGGSGGFPIDRKDTGGKIYGGYEFTPNIALELGYVNFGEFEVPGAGKFENDGAFLDIVGKIPFTPQLSGIARIGAFNGKAEFTSATALLPSTSERNTKPKVGFGVQYDFTKNVAMRAEWERYRFEAFGGKANTDLASIGVQYRF